MDGGRPVNSRMLLRGGLVADGIGATVRRADVLIEGPVIAAVGSIDVPPGECEVIDLPPGSVVCPGFIDAHAHAEGPLLASGRVEGALAQGVTTLVVGQDGESWIGAERDHGAVPEPVLRAGQRDAGAGHGTSAWPASATR